MESYAFPNEIEDTQFLENQKKLARQRKIKRNIEVLKKTEESFKKAAEGSKIRALGEGVSTGLRLRKYSKEGVIVSWMIPFAMAIALDGFAPFDITYIITFFFETVLFIFMWGRGKWKVKLVVYTLIFLEFLPIINIIPMNTVAVVYAYYKNSQKLKEDAEKEKSQKVED